MLPKTGVPYKSNGYASEPDTNYDSDYALRYNSVDRKRTTSTGNQNDEKWVDLIWFPITKTKKAFDMAQWTPMGARSFQIWFLRTAREAECHSVQESAGQNRALHARKLICVGKRSEAGNNRLHPASPTNIDSSLPEQEWAHFRTAKWSVMIVSHFTAHVSFMTIDLLMRSKLFRNYTRHPVVTARRWNRQFHSVAYPLYHFIFSLCHSIDCNP